MYDNDHTLSEVANAQISHQAHIKWIISLVIAYGHVSIPRGFVWVCIG